MTMTTDADLLPLAERIRQHAYTWGPSEIIPGEAGGPGIQPFQGGPFNPFPGEPAFEVEIQTDMEEVLGIETEGWIVLVFTPDGRYAKLRWDRLPMVLTDDGSGVRIFDVNIPDDAQKPYETHGFN